MSNNTPVILTNEGTKTESTMTNDNDRLASTVITRTQKHLGDLNDCTWEGDKPKVSG